MISLILASRSAIRLEILRNAGLEVRAVQPQVDEASIKARCREAGDSTEQASVSLALAKSRNVSSDEPSALVVGADQILDFEGDWLDKPRDRADAKDQLRRLAGHTHRLVTGICLVRSDEEMWRYSETADLSMVALDDATIDRYLDAISDNAYTSVGAYQIESRGIGLFRHISGDHFSILGLPLSPLIHVLRTHGFSIP